MDKKIKAKLIDGSSIVLKVSNDSFTKLISDTFEEINFDNNVFVSPGWIDMHTHCDPTNQLYGTPSADSVGYKQGVVMVIDGGSTGKDNYLKFKNNVANQKTIVKAFLNISRKGIHVQSELSNLNDIDFNDVDDEFIVGYKIRMSKSVVGSNGISSLLKFKENRKDDMPLLIHIGNEPPLFEQFVGLLDSKDVITHIFNGKNQSLFKNSSPTKNLKIAMKNGVKFDLGHGSESFNWNVAKNINKNNFNLDVISTDIYERNQLNGVVGSLYITMSKIKLLGYSWQEVINKVTNEPANILGFRNWDLLPGSKANATFFKIIKTKRQVWDSVGNEINLNELIIPIAVLINGELINLEVKNETNK